jgi:hypothetical protein
MPKTSVQARATGGNGNGAAMYDAPVFGAINPFTFFTINLAGANADPVPVWSYYPQQRDIWLRLLSRYEPIMASALYSMTSRFKSLRWNIARGGRNDKKYYQRLFAEADGGEGYGSFASKVVTDLLTQDNGAFIELVGAGREDKPLAGRVTELWHMDAGQCWRTFDPEFPVIYINPLDNTYHRMHHSRIIRLSSFPQSDERARGIGFCAVSRALKLMQTMRNIQTFRDEKVTGKFNRGLIYGNGVTVKQFDEAVEKSEAVAESLNFTIYKDIPVLLSMMPDMKLNVLDLASLPEGFDYEKEITLYVYSLAMAFGTDAREFWPATASGATKADATVQHMKSQGKGMADIITSFETAFGWQVMPENGKCDFEYDFTDDDQDRAVADLQTVEIANITGMISAGLIDAFEGRALAISRGLIDVKALASMAAPEPADDSGPMDNEDDSAPPLDQPSNPPADQPLGNLTIAAKDFPKDGPKNPNVGKAGFDEHKHPRKGGKFTSKGGATGDQAEQPPASPLAQRLDAFLGILNRQGTYKDGVLTIPDATRNRSADMQTYLRDKGYPNAVVTAKRVGKDMVYTIGGAADTKKTGKRRGGRKKKTATAGTAKPKTKKKTDIAAIVHKALHGAIHAGRKDSSLEDYIAAYQAELENLYDDFIVNVIRDPADYDAALDDLYDEFLNQMPVYLTTGYGVGLQDSPVSADSVARLKQIGQTSADFMQDSFIAALSTLGIVAGSDQDIRNQLDGFRARFLMYAGAMWNALWEGLRGATDDKLKVKRIMEAGAAHCDVCPDLAKVYDSFADMVAEAGLPGDGSTPCLSNCRCKLEVETAIGSGVFAPLSGAPTIFIEPLFEVLR